MLVWRLPIIVKINAEIRQLQDFKVDHMSTYRTYGTRKGVFASSDFVNSTLELFPRC